MFLNLWSKPRSEQVVREKEQFRPISPLHSPIIHATPFLNNMKRKWDEDHVATARFESPPLKKRTETMSHVEIPAYGLQRVAPAFHAMRTDSRLLLAPLRTASLGNPSAQQADTAQGRTSPSKSFPIATAATVMDTATDWDDQGRNTTSSNRSIPSTDSIRSIIESEFSLQILLKHKELRLIDQELAKCQTALEQLRRCQVIPYPATSSDVEAMEAVSQGTGPVHDNSALHAPPWGIVNGPYTQHYARWLLQDPVFDDTMAAIGSSSYAGLERPSRGSKSEKSAILGSSRSSRGNNNARLTSLPDGYAVPKEEKGPCIVTRSSDGKRVKLVCLSCRRSDFNSPQGFINHCRIAHSQAFASHDEAIDQCGEEINGEHEIGNTEVAKAQGTSNAGLVHPLVRSAFATSASIIQAAPKPPVKKGKASGPTAAPAAVSSQGNVSSSLDKREQVEPVPGRSGNKVLDSAGGSPVAFKPSAQTPHLSALFARIGKSGNLDELVAEATRKPEIVLGDLSEEEDEEETSEETSQSQPMVQSRSTRGVIREQVSVEVNPSSLVPQRRPHDANGTPKIANFSEHPAYPSPYSVRNDDSHSQTDTSVHDMSPHLNLSPNTTDPHPAPSLVSDDGDYENMHSDSESPSDVGDERDPRHDPEVIDHDDLDPGEASGLNLTHTKQHHNHHHGSPTELVTVGRRSRPSTATGVVDSIEDGRHVTFAGAADRQRRGSKATKGSH